MQCFTKSNDLVPPRSKFAKVVIDKTPPSPTSCCIDGGDGGDTPFVVTQRPPPFGPRRRFLMVSIMESAPRRTAPWSFSVNQTLQSALDTSSLKNSQSSPGFACDDGDEILSKDAYRRNLLKDDMTLLHRELSRLSNNESDQNEYDSQPSDSNLEDDNNEDDDEDDYEGSTGNDYSFGDASVDFSKVRAAFHLEQKISTP
jgi:hypothetical protein